MVKYYDIRIPDTGHDFELLTKKVCERKYGLAFEQYGHTGQRQSGIDLFCKSFSVCVQCKNYQGSDANKRLLSEVKKDFLSAYHKFGNKMTKYVLATTVRRDTHVQDLVSELSEEYSFDIRVMFWEDFQEILNAHPEIIAEHNSSISNLDNVSSICRLVVEQNGTSIRLDYSSVEILKRIHRDFQEKKRYPINVELVVKDYDDLAILREREDLRQGYGDDFAKYEASQMLRKKYRSNKEVFNTAIEYMLQDEMLDSCALLLKQKYIDQHGIEACSYYDEYGIACDYWTVFLWIEIVEEMVKELIIDRYYEYGNDRSLAEIDCCARTRQGRDLWYFVSYVSNKSENAKHSDMLSRLRWAGCDYLDIPRRELVAHVYPDFYYNIGLLKQHDEELFGKLAENSAWVFNLYYYTFGLH